MVVTRRQQFVASVRHKAAAVAVVLSAVSTRSQRLIFTLGSDTPDMPDTNGRNLFQRCVIVKHNPCIITYNQVHHQHGGLQAGRHGGDVYPTSKG